MSVHGKCEICNRFKLTYHTHDDLDDAPPMWLCDRCRKKYIKRHALGSKPRKRDSKGYDYT